MPEEQNVWSLCVSGWSGKGWGGRWLLIYRAVLHMEMFHLVVSRLCLGSQHHLKKLEGRRLDFDYKKKRQAKIPEEEVRQAVEKFDESRELAERSMINFLESDVSHRHGV